MNFSELKTQAKAKLKGHVLAYFGITLVLSLILGASGITFIGVILLTGPITLGIAMLAIEIYRNSECHLNTGFKGFNQFGEAFVSYFLSGLFTILWSFLLVIPGIIAAYRYSMVYYILVDNPGIGGLEAISRSKKMMHGHKMELFLLELSFIGWALLGILTCGILYIWLIPYIETTKVAYYEKLKELSDNTTNQSSESPKDNINL